MNNYELFDDTNNMTYRFTGELLADDESNGDLRWTQIRVYKTAEGAYIREKIGHSLVFHRVDADSVRCRTAGKLLTYLSLDEYSVPCTFCHPAPISSLSDVARNVRVEVPIADIIVSTKPEGFVDAMQAQDRNGQRFTSHLARRILKTVADKDHAVMEITNGDVQVIR